ncbi:MAG: hypothetical protein KF841_07495 [Phycisphaerae bacterium]|nr:hypothetical protein [Phycisphaerae bacterium]
MPRRLLTFIISGVLLAVTSGATSALHDAHDAHHAAGSDDCQTCHFIKVTTAAVIVSSLVVFLSRDAHRDIRPAQAVIKPRRCGRGSPSGPRAPPTL